MNEQEQKLYNSTLALAGVLQASLLVRDYAKQGSADDAAFNASIQSIFKIDAKDVPDVFSGEHGVRLGLLEIVRLFGDQKAKADSMIGRYMISIFHLEAKLKNNAEVFKNLTRRIKYAASQANYFSPTHTNVIASLADIYLNTLGTLSFRIQVFGHVKILNQTDVVQKVRALLLAGIRAAVLWRQIGGKRWQLFFWRRKFLDMAKKILNAMNS